MKICFVLSGQPGYSETFIVNKINGLIDSNADIYFSAGSQKISSIKAKQLYGYRKNDGLVAAIRLVKDILINILLPVHVVNFFRLEKKNGRSNKEILKNFVLNAHLIYRSFDWIHFEFATLIIGNENIPKTTGARCGISLRGFDIGIYPLKFPGCYSLAWKVADKIHVISDDIYKLALKNGMPNNLAVQKIYPAINLNTFSPVEIPQKNKYELFSAGRLHWKKGYNCAIEALDILKKRGTQVKLNIAGTGKDYERIKFLAFSKGIDNLVEFKGKVEHKKLPAMLAEHTIYIQPSLQEGFCNSAIEAQAMGLFCIVSDAEGLPENVIDNQTGFVFARGNAKALADAIEKALNMNEKEMNEFRNRAIKHVHKNFNLKEQIEQFKQFYEIP